MNSSIIRDVEAGWYDWWKARGFFSPEVHCAADRKKMEKKRFSMVLPPPNVTGVLHLGHALTATIQVNTGYQFIWIYRP